MDGVLKGRGATINPAGRFAATTHDPVDDGWYQESVPDSIATEVRPEAARSIISRNDCPDSPRSRSIPPRLSTAAFTAMRPQVPTSICLPASI
jgi:hypothetical protein